MARPRCLLLATLAVDALWLAAGAAKHLIVSSPGQSKVFYSNDTQSIADPASVEMVLDAQGNPMVPPLDMHMILTPADVEMPMGVAIERSKRHDPELGFEVEDRFLYVADPGRNCALMHVGRWPLYESNGHFWVGEKQVVLRDKCVRWIAVDYLGNLFATCEETGEILKVPAELMRRGGQGSNPTVLYSSGGPNGMQVTAPGGIAADAFSVYWSNKVLGSITGSVVRGSSYMPAGRVALPSVVPIARNADLGRDYGVCIAGQTVFYTEREKNLYAVGRDGGAIALISDALQEPRGCAWDRDNTVYVVDRSRGRIFSFAGAMRNLRTVGRVKSASIIDDPFDVAVVDGAAGLAPAASLLALLAGLAARRV